MASAICACHQRQRAPRRFLLGRGAGQRRGLQQVARPHELAVQRFQLAHLPGDGARLLRHFLFRDQILGAQRTRVVQQLARVLEFGGGLLALDR